MKTKQKLILILILMLMLMLTLLALASCSNSKGACPTPTSETKLLTNAEDGYCLLYPAEYSTTVPYYIVINPISSPDMLGEAWLYIAIADAAGQTAAQVADELIAVAGDGFNITRFEVEVDGEQAVVVDGLPAQDSARQVFIVHNERLYNLVFMPWYPNVAEPTPLENLYTMVMDTLHFLPQE